MITGAWRLNRWTRTNADGRTFEPFGEQPFGRLIYDPTGAMAAFLMRPDWPGQGADATPQARWLIAYSGRYAWDIDVVSHHVDASSDPRWIGAVLRRRASFDGDRVLLTTLEDGPSPPSQTLEWTREHR